MRIQFIIPGGHASKLFESAEEPLDGVALGVAGCVMGAWVPALAPGRNYGTGAARGQGGHERVGIVAAVGHLERRREAREQGQRLRGVVALADGEAAAHRPAAGVGGHVHLARKPAAAAPEGLRSVFLRAPLACWCARTVVESTSSVCSASSCCTASNARCHTPEAAQRWKRVYVVCQLPRSLGNARHRAPLRASQSTASTTWRLSRPRPPLVPSRPGSNGARRDHCASVNSISIPQLTNHC